MSRQTPKVLSALLAQLPDNVSGAITAENVRDAVVSLYPSRGALRLVQPPIATVFAQAGAYVKIAGTTEVPADVCSTCVDMPSFGELQFLKPVSQVLLLNAVLEVLPAGNNTQYTFAFAKNGTPIAGTALSFLFGNLQGRPVGIPLSSLVPIEGNDVISVVVKNEVNTTSITASALSFSGVGFIK